MKYGLLKYETYNIGDEIQSIAAKQFLPIIDYLINRDNIDASDIKEKTKLILNGWFMESPENWPIKNENIDPLFISFHISDYIGVSHKKLLSQESIEYYKRYEPIGCRDIYTVDLLIKAGVRAYFSGCLTLTLGKKTNEKTDKIYIVDVDPEIKKLIPSDILKDVSFSKHIFYKEKIDDKFLLAENLLNDYSKAKLVITSRLHCALPCLAFGTPVVFINDNLNDARFKGLIEMIRHYSTEDLKKGIVDINWKYPLPNPYDISALRRSLIEKCNQFILGTDLYYQEDVTVVIGIKNRYDHKVINALKSIRNQTYDQNLIKIILIDYGSKNEYLIEFQKLCEQFKINGLWTKTMLPWSRSKCLNIGLKEANTKYILSSDVDIVFDKNYIQECVNEIKINPLRCIHSTVLYSNITKEIDIEDYDKFRNTAVPCQNDMGMGILFFEKKWANIINGYDEYFRLWGYEDNDFVGRLKSCGIELKNINYKTYYMHQHHSLYNGVEDNKDLEKTIKANHYYYINNNSIVRNCLFKNIKYNSGQEMILFDKKQLAITSLVGCPINCKLCPQKILIEQYAKKSNIFEMSLNLFKGYLDKIPKSVKIRFSGFCENFVNKSCIDMIDYTFNSGFKMCLYSTLEGASIDVIKKLTKYPFFEFCIHLADCDNYSKIIVNDEYLEKIEFAVSHLGAWYMCHSLQPEQRVGNILSKHNRECQSIGEGDSRANVLEGGWRCNYKKGKLKCSDKICPPMPQTNVLLPNGDIGLCTQDYTLENILGNLSLEKYEDIISVDNPVYKEILRKMNSEDEYILCRKCNHAVNI